MEQSLDLNDCKPREAAFKLYDFLVNCLDSSFGSKEEPQKQVVLFSPEESRQRGYGACWRVMWEEGPWEWAVYLTLGEKVSGIDVDLWEAPKFLAEPYHSFDIGFFPNEPLYHRLDNPEVP